MLLIFFPVWRAIAFDFFNIRTPQLRKRLLFAKHIANMHVFVLIQRHTDDFRTLEITWKKTTGNRVGIGAQQKIHQTAGVADLDAFVRGDIAVELLRKISDVVTALHEIEARITLEIDEADAVLTRRNTCGFTVNRS